MECGIALGSNAGDRFASLRAAVAALRRQDPGLEVSPVYETEPVDCPEGSGRFLNAVAILRWEKSPPALLEFLRGIESDLGRPPLRSQNAPRTIDLDILYAGDTVCDHGGLTLPHPRLHLRWFVLAPLADLRADLRLPGFSRSVRELLEAVPADGPPPTRVEANEIIHASEHPRGVQD
jgi:2-amino-4-hydroxy-6-hydroxymethyldihydropteridine diphosphokinase